MRQRIYVGNVAAGVTNAELGALFAAFGTVHGGDIALDAATGHSRHFAFVEMEAASAAAAIAALHGRELHGHALFVTAAAPSGGAAPASA